jgi:hypothetical protein
VGEGGGIVWHFSEEPGIAQFEPRTGAAGAPDEALVWAIDAEHAPSYWFPRDCPRVTFWRGAAEPYVVARRPVRPVGTEPLGDLLARHAAAGIELRLVPTIWPLVDAVVGSGLEFSIIRKRPTAPR